MAADVTAKWALDVEVDADEALQGAGKLEVFSKRVKEDQNELANLRKAMALLKKTGAITKEEFEAMGTKALALKERVAKNTKAFIDGGGSLKDLFRPQVQKAGADVDSLKTALLGAIPGAQRAWGALSAVKLSTLGMAAAIVSTVAVLVGLSVAFGAATISATRFAAAEANVARNQRLALEEMIRYDMLLRRVAGVKDAAVYARQFDQAITDLAPDVSQSRDELAGMAQELWNMRLRGNQLQEALRGSALVGGVQKFLALGYTAQGAGRNIHQLAVTVEKQFGGLMQKRLLSLDVQTRKLRENFKILFRDLKLEPMLRGMKEFTDLFSQNTVTGNALKTIVEGIFQPLLDGAGVLGTVVKPAFQGLVIAALVLTIAVLKVRNAIADAFPDSGVDQIDEYQLALGVATVAVVAAGAAFLGLAAGVTATTVALATLMLPAVAVYEAFQWIRSIDTKSIGEGLMSGLLLGIKSYVDLIVEEVQALATKIKGKLTSALGIHSPSTFGKWAIKMVGAGMVEGGRESERDVGRAGQRMADAAASGMERAPAAAAGGAGPGMTVNVVFHYEGSAELPPEFEAQVEEKLTTVFEKLARKMGFAPVGATG